MDEKGIRKLLLEVRSGRLRLEAALERLRHLPYEDLGFARLDRHRALRRGFPEIVYGEGKSDAQLVSIVKRLGRGGAPAGQLFAEFVKLNFGQPFILFLLLFLGPFFSQSGRYRLSRDLLLHSDAKASAMCASLLFLVVLDFGSRRGALTYPAVLHCPGGFTAVNFTLATLPSTRARSSLAGGGVNSSPGQQAIASNSFCVRK